MPRQGEKFINAVGIEVVAHGGATPANPDPTPARRRQAINSDTVAYDVFGRPYGPSEPVFMTTGSEWVVDRLAITNASETGAPFGPLQNAYTLAALADEIGYVVPPYEFGMPSAEWIANNPQIVHEFNIQEGFGLNYFVEMAGLIDGVAATDTELSVVVLGNDPLVAIATWSWKLNGVEVATTPTYAPPRSEAGKQVRCDTTPTLPRYGDGASTSSYPVTAFSYTVSMTGITGGEAVPDAVLGVTASGGVAIGAWSWALDDIEVATSPTYTVLEIDDGKTVRCDTTALLPRYGTAATAEYPVVAPATGLPAAGLIGAYDFARADLIDATGLILNSIAPYEGSGPTLDQVAGNAYWSEEQGAFICTDVNAGTQLISSPADYPNGAFCSVFLVFCARINPIATGTSGATRTMNGRNGGAVMPRGTFTTFQLLVGGNQGVNGFGELEIAGYGFQPNDNSAAWTVASVAGAPVYIEGSRTQPAASHDQVGVGAASATIYGISIYEAVFYDRYLSEEEAVQVVEYLQTKYAAKVPVAVTPDLPYNGVLNSGTDGSGVTGFQSGNVALDPQSLTPWNVNGALSATYEFVTLPADVILLEPQQDLEVPFRMSAGYGVTEITVTVQGHAAVVMNWTGQAYVANSASLRAHMEANVGVDLTINIVQGGPIAAQQPGEIE